jgi:hypothetical protein
LKKGVKCWRLFLNLETKQSGEKVHPLFSCISTDKIQGLQKKSREPEKVPPNFSTKMTSYQMLINFILIVCLFVKLSETYQPNDVIVRNLRLYVEGFLVFFFLVFSWEVCCFNHLLFYNFDLEKNFSSKEWPIIQFHLEFKVWILSLEMEVEAFVLRSW